VERTEEKVSEKENAPLNPSIAARQFDEIGFGHSSYGGSRGEASQIIHHLLLNRIIPNFTSSIIIITKRTDSGILGRGRRPRRRNFFWPMKSFLLGSEI
jgi:hypothetical protein